MATDGMNAHGSLNRLGASLINAGAAYQPDAKWPPSEADRPVWDFMHKALAQR
jgi:hypothetical protein